MSDHTENCISPNGICNVSLLQEIIDSNIAPIVENLAAATDVCNFTPATKLDEAPESLEMPAETVYINEIDEITTVGNNAVNSFPDSRDFGAPPSDDLMKIEVVLEENDEMEAEESAPTEPDVIAEEPSGHILLDAERSHKKFVSAPEAQIEPEVLPELEEEEYGMKPTVAFLDLYSEVKRKEALNYYVELVAGYPGVPYRLEVDSGSSLLWLQAVTNPLDKVPHGQTAYDTLNDSPTRLSMGPKARNQAYSYSGNTTVYHHLYQDRVYVGATTAEGQMLGAAPISKLPERFKDRPFQGILGLAPPQADSSGEIPPYKNIVMNLKGQGAIRTAAFTMIGCSVDTKLISPDLQDKGPRRGYLAVGTPYADFVRNNRVLWCPLADEESSLKGWGKGRWVIKLDKILINGTEVFKDQVALIDTGCSFILANTMNFAKTLQTLNGKRVMSSLFKYDEKSLSSISFVFGANALDLEPNNFSLGLPEEGSSERVSCITLAPSTIPNNVWILGGVFLDTMVTIFEYEKKRVGFADLTDQNLADFGTRL